MRDQVANKKTGPIGRNCFVQMTQKVLVNNITMIPICGVSVSPFGVVQNGPTVSLEGRTGLFRVDAHETRNRFQQGQAHRLSLTCRIGSLGKQGYHFDGIGDKQGQVHAEFSRGRTKQIPNDLGRVDLYVETHGIGVGRHDPSFHFFQDNLYFGFGLEGLQVALLRHQRRDEPQDLVFCHRTGRFIVEQF